jgi:uncharacterized cofD-like protein
MRLSTRTRSYLRWLSPGLGVKRWLVVIMAGIVLLGLMVGLLLAPLRPLALLPYLTLDFIPILWVRVLIVGGLGTAAVALGLTRLQQSLLAPFSQGYVPVVDSIYRHRVRERGPKVVALGGGHGLSTLLRGLKHHTSNITAVLTVADDGGSSGRLRRALGVLPPGDFRNCIAALADDEALITQLFQYRFPLTVDEAGLNGHSLGNLFITAMADVSGSFERAVLESSRVLAIRGRVLPSTLESVTLVGDLRAGPTRVDRVAGESSITDSRGVIERVSLEPDNAPAYPEVLRAILEADLIVAGPGSLYTSVLPNLLVREISQAIAASRALAVYVCNVATQLGETDGYTLADHMQALGRHVGAHLFPVVLANDELEPGVTLPEGVELVAPQIAPGVPYRLHSAALLDAACPWRHDSTKLARELLRLLEQAQ